MQELPYVFVGSLAVLASFARMRIFRGQTELYQKMAAGGLAVMTWGIWALASLNVQRGDEVTAYVSLALLGAVGASVMALDIVMLTFNEVGEIRA